MMMDRFFRLFRVSRDINDIMAMSERDLADLGVSRTEAMELAALPDEVPARVREMAKVYGLSADELLADRRLWHELLHGCNHCADVAACDRFLSRPAKDEPVDAATLTFCPNRERFATASVALAN